jgi:farnesyl diphosphate synthase
MAFDQRLKQSAAEVEARLDAVLAEVAAAGTPQRLVQAMRYAALDGGKRFRAFLVIECSGIFGVTMDRAVHTAAALECVHAYSLVHDDLPAMDNDALRRGKPTLHVAFDEWTAILAGDALLTLAFRILADRAAHGNATVRAELIAGLAQAAGAAGMAGGQCLDLEAEKLGLPEKMSVGHIERLQAMKTGALIRFSCEAGAILGTAGAQERQAICTYGENIGRAFQIADDLLDVEGDAQTLGKGVRKDAGKATFVSLVGLEAARQQLAHRHAEAVAALEPFGSRAEVLREAARFVVLRKS